MDHVATIDQERGTLLTKLKRIEPVLRETGIARLDIFGSRARGDHRPESDLDLLADLAEGRRFTLINLIGVEELIGEATGLRAYISTWRSVPARHLEELRRQAVRVF